MPVTSRVKTNVTLLLSRYGMGQPKSLLIMANSRMGVIKHESFGMFLLFVP